MRSQIESTDDGQVFNDQRSTMLYLLAAAGILLSASGCSQAPQNPPRHVPSASKTCKLGSHELSQRAKRKEVGSDNYLRCRSDGQIVLSSDESDPRGCALDVRYSTSVEVFPPGEHIRRKFLYSLGNMLDLSGLCQTDGQIHVTDVQE